MRDKSSSYSQREETQHWMYLLWDVRLKWMYTEILRKKKECKLKCMCMCILYVYTVLYTYYCSINKWDPASSSWPLTDEIQCCSPFMPMPSTKKVAGMIIPCFLSGNGIKVQRGWPHACHRGVDCQISFCVQLFMVTKMRLSSHSVNQCFHLLYSHRAFGHFWNASKKGTYLPRGGHLHLHQLEFDADNANHASFL